MSYRKRVVADLIATAREHDDLARSKGWKADAETDALVAKHREVRAGATSEEAALFDRICSPKHSS